MHYSVYVFTRKKPTPNHLASLLEPYGDGKEWDWWVVGGRWTGVLSGYEPDKDPANWEICDLCHGTGTRTQPVPGNPDWKPVPGKCNGCERDRSHGLPLGYHVAWNFQPHPGDTQRVADALLLLQSNPPYAFLTDGPLTGWKGTENLLPDWISNEVRNSNPKPDYSDYMLPNPNFQSLYSQTLLSYTPHYVTAIDCHN